MNAIGPIIDIVMPVFGLVGLGYGAVRAGWFKDAWTDGIAAYVFQLAIPLLLFSSLARLDIGHVFDWRLLTGYYTAALATYGLTTFLAGALFKRPRTDSIVIGFAGTFSNLVLLGIPLVVTAFGPEAAGRLVLIIAFHAPILLTLCAILMATARGAENGGGVLGVVRRTVTDMVRNPILIGIVAGLVWNLLSLPLGGWPAAIVDKLAGSAGACALFAAGASLTRYQIVRAIPEAIMISIMKLAVLPALVALMVLVVLPVPFETARVAIIAAAMPAGVNAFLVANNYKIAEGANSSAIVLSTAIAIFTVTAVLAFLGA